MNLQNLLLIILGISGVLLVVLLVLLNVVQRKLKGTQYQEQRRLKALLPTRTKEKDGWSRPIKLIRYLMNCH